MRQWLATARSDLVLAEALSRSSVPHGQHLSEAVREAVVLPAPVRSRGDDAGENARDGPPPPETPEQRSENEVQIDAALSGDESAAASHDADAPMLRRPASPSFLAGMTTAMDAAPAASPHLRGVCQAIVHAAHSRVELLERLKVQPLTLRHRCALGYSVWHRI